MEQYIRAEMEVVEFEAEDIVTASGCPLDQASGCPADSFDGPWVPIG